LHHQQRWGQIPAQQTQGNQVQNRPQEQDHSSIHVAASSRPLQQSAGATTYIIPLVVEGSDKKMTPSNTGNRIAGQTTKP